jgi:sugar lactone lactonase YvrE
MLTIRQPVDRLGWAFLMSCLIVAVSSQAQTSDCSLKDGGSELPATSKKTFDALRPDTPDMAAVRFNMAIDYARVGNTKKALSLLEESLKETPWLDPSSENDFAPLRGCASFQKLVEREHQKYHPVNASRVVYTVPQKDLIPEGLASDPGDGTLYLSSIYHRKVVKITPEGRVSDFVTEGQDNLLGVLGIKVDARDHSVWAASERSGQSALFHFDRNGKTLNKYVPEQPGPHEFNDLVVTMEGDVFVTDDLDNAVYKLARGFDKLVRIDLGGRFYPNGIALAADEKKVYVAHAFGIVVMGLHGGSVADLREPKDVSLSAVDGLYVRNGSLIAIQNAFGGNRIVQLRLSVDGKRILSGKLLEFRSPNLELPTTGTIYQDRFYYIVNSQIDHEENGKLVGEDKLQPIKIAALKLE